MTRTSHHRTVALFGIAVVLAAGLAWGIGSALAADEGASPAASGDKVTAQFGWFQNVDSLNPFVCYQNVSYSIIGIQYDTLVRYDPATLKPIPGVAESWEHSEDGKTWTFHLRKDVKWQDGEPLTAKDVAFTFNYIVDNEMGAFTTYTNAIESVTAVDDYTVRFDCSKAKAGMLQMWVYILPEHIWGKVKADDAESKYRNDPPIVGSGPFQVVEWKKNQYVKLVANKDYWGGAPRIDEVIIRLYTNMDTLAADLKGGSVAWGNVTEAQYRSFESLPGWAVTKPHDDKFENLGFNAYAGPSGAHPAVRDWKFRQALNWAIDRDKIASVAYNTAAIPATGFLPSEFFDPSLDYHWEPPADQKYTYDPEKAKAALDAAGYKDTDGDGVRDYQGKPIKLRLWALSEKSEYTRTGKLMAGWFRDIGLEIELQTLDDGTVSDHLYRVVDGKFNPDGDMFIWGWGGDFDPGFLLSVFTTAQINNWSDCAWSNKEYDKLFAEQDTTLDPEARKQLIWKMQEIVYRESPYIVFVYPLDLEAYDTAHWDGWTHQPANMGTVENYWTYLNLEPRSGGETAADKGSNTAVILIVAVVVAVVVIGLVVWLTRRRKPHAVEE